MKNQRKKANRRAIPLWQSLWQRCPDSVKNAGKTATTAMVSWVKRGCNFMAEVEACAGETDKFSLWRTLLSIPSGVRQVLHDTKVKRFPESNSPLVQLIYFTMGAWPMVTSAISDGFTRQTHKLGSLLRTTAACASERKSWHVATFLTSSGAIAGVAVFLSMYTVGATVQYGDITATVASEAVAAEIIAEVEQVSVPTQGTVMTLDASQVEYSSELILRSAIVDASVVVEEVSTAIVQEQGDASLQEGYVLYIDGDAIGATPYAGALEELLDQLKSSVTDENTISCDFAEEVEVVQEYISDDQIVNLGHVAETLFSTKTGEVTYTVVSGDTWNAIAIAHDLTSSELLAMNPGYDTNKLSIGDVLTVSTAVPYLTVTVQQRESYVATVNYSIEYTDSADLYQGDYKVTSAGVNGTADTVANVTYVNGVEVSRTILSSVNLEEPVTEQRLQGTMERPSWMATGSFRWPTSGTITSYFGYRSAFSGASTYHQGIDIANSYGTAIYAADGGTIVYAGWQSGYGYLVEIDHGNGYTTRYGHNSSLLVSVGDKVYKGQQIAKMGSTGVSSGNHCHFEIRYNGTANNPISYLP